MGTHAMLVDYGYCTGCRSCEISCRKEKGLPLDEWGIKVSEMGPKRLAGAWEWDYVPVPSRVCDLCADRRAQGKLALCELHCLAHVIEVIPVGEVSRRLEGSESGKLCCFMP